MLSQIEKNLVYRVLDANFNRSVEGLRVVEEYFRFIAENRSITTELKELRHQIYSSCMDWIEIWSGQRDSASDVGSTIALESEYKRLETEDLVGANLARVNQALRAMEEYSKAVSPDLAARIEQIRYQFYEVEKIVKRAIRVASTFHDKSLYVLTSACKSTAEFESRVKALCEAGADLIQLRDKELDDSELLKRAKLAANLCSDYPTLFIVNDRPDLALMSGSDGVHVGQEELPIGEIRKIFSNKMLIGVSTHSIEQAVKAQQDGADYIGVGPTFPSHTKCFSEFTGTQLLKEVAEVISVPAFAIGGVNLENVDQVVEAGFTRVAVSNAVHQADTYQTAIKQFKTALSVSN